MKSKCCITIAFGFGILAGMASCSQPTRPGSQSRLPENKTFVIRTHNNSKENKYIRSVKLNGKELDVLEIPHSSIVSAGLLEFEMSGEPALK